MQHLKVKLCFTPICCSGHWVLLEVAVAEAAAGGSELQVTYRDSLKIPSAACRHYAELAVQNLLGMEGLPAGRANAAVQPEGSGVCGCYILHWMEQSCRRVVHGEPACSTGWPSAVAWASRLQSAVACLQREQLKLLEGSKKEKAAEEETL